MWEGRVDERERGENIRWGREAGLMKEEGGGKSRDGAGRWRR